MDLCAGGVLSCLGMWYLLRSTQECRSRDLGPWSDLWQRFFCGFLRLRLYCTYIVQRGNETLIDWGGRLLRRSTTDTVYVREEDTAIQKKKSACCVVADKSLKCTASIANSHLLNQPTLPRKLIRYLPRMLLLFSQERVLSHTAPAWQRLKRSLTCGLSRRWAADQQNSPHSG